MHRKSKNPFFWLQKRDLKNDQKWLYLEPKKKMDMYKIAKPLVASNLPYDIDRFLENKPWTNCPISMNFRQLFHVSHVAAFPPLSHHEKSVTLDTDDKNFVNQVSQLYKKLSKYQRVLSNFEKQIQLKFSKRKIRTKKRVIQCSQKKSLFIYN